MISPGLFFGAFWSSSSMSTWRYSAGLARARGSKPRSPATASDHYSDQVRAGCTESVSTQDCVRHGEQRLGYGDSKTLHQPCKITFLSYLMTLYNPMRQTRMRPTGHRNLKTRVGEGSVRLPRASHL